jgi:nanoRNase/pAp phosphatase (c-di-AMP/oligoRNAs hydrolase)
MYPTQNVSVSIFNRRESDYSVIFCGHNIFNRTCKTDINELMKKFNGSGRTTAGTCIVHQNEADEVLRQIIDELKENGE